MKEDRTMKGYAEAWKYICGETKNDLTVVRKYSVFVNFLQQDLALWQFVACGEDGKPLRHPDKLKGTYTNGKAAAKYRERYQEAQDRVIFEGFKIDNRGFDWEGYDFDITNEKECYHVIDGKVMEDLDHGLFPFRAVEELVGRNITLTPSKYAGIYK